MLLKNYQQTAVSKLVDRSKELLSQNGNKKIIFKSPTGSGKTIMMGNFLFDLINDHEITKPLCFIWTAPRQLHNQSKDKLEQYYENSNAIECVVFEDLLDNKIAENQMLFLNWESINKKDKNTIVKENEKDFYLGKVIENTQDDGIEIVLIIDESHHHAKSEISNDLIKDISAKLTFEVSATPTIHDADEIVTVPLDDVKHDGMIKKTILLNPNFENIISNQTIDSVLSKSSNLVVLEEALKKRNELLKAYQKFKIDVNPLLLIQLPDRKTDQEDAIKEEIINFLKDKHSISVNNEKLAIYLSEEKENLNNISKNTNQVEVLIFKQAIALGWDCPRAHLLVLLRDWKSLSFSIQTVGRIMRMPLPDQGHFDLDLLNHGYLYSNLSDIEITEDIASSYLSIYTSKRINEYKPLKLTSYHSARQREKTRLSPKFIDIFYNEADKYELDKKISLENKSISIAYISDFESSNVDDLIKTEINSRKKVDTDNEEEIQRLFNFYIKSSLTPFYPEERSIGRLKESLYFYFNKKFKLSYSDNFIDIVKIILGTENKIHFNNVIEKTKQTYINLTKDLKRKLIYIDNWEIPEQINYNSNIKQESYNKSIMIPFFNDQKWKTEIQFIKFLDSSKGVRWWFKNGDRDATYFAVPYTENGEEYPFYVDFIVQHKNGTIGLYDTKSGNTIKDAKEKSDGLLLYINAHKDKNLTGGIVTNTNQSNFDGMWVVYQGKSENINKNDLSNWNNLDFT
jgi:type III restriction enzyme